MHYAERLHATKSSPPAGLSPSEDPSQQGPQHFSVQHQRSHHVAAQHANETSGSGQRPTSDRNISSASPTSNPESHLTPGNKHGLRIAQLHS